MRFSQVLALFASSVVCVAGSAKFSYTLQQNYDYTNFFAEFDFFNKTDPTNGFVKYVGETVANSSSLAGYTNNAVYLGVDYQTANPAGGRKSVRLTSKQSFTKGLFIADIAHMPDSICGVWPAFWTTGPGWPAGGEIDIIENVNLATSDAMTLHTSANCSMADTGSNPSSTLSDPDCNSGDAHNGCSITTPDDTSFGSGFNSVNGGVYAMEWTSDLIQVFFFPRASIPSDITAGTPDPTNSAWGTPTAKFTGCDIDSHFYQHNIIFDTTFCGDWAGKSWSGTGNLCAANTGASSCEAYVGQNPSAFENAYWSINSVKVYSQGTSTKKRDLTNSAKGYSQGSSIKKRDLTGINWVA
ncbi:hypothetical protein B7494_g6365 [Chlorociboria aeruginascens]|nr:hypothetical protein B7494_g6365 [Chlorociboria aeruginascens]